MKKIISFLLMGILIISLPGCGKKEEAPAPKDYYCEKGTLRGNNCELALTEESIKVCENGYQQIEDKCIKTEIVDAQAIKTCPTGFKILNDKCISEVDIPKLENKDCVLPLEQDKGTIKVLENGSYINSSNKAYIKDNVCYISIWEDYNATLDAYFNNKTYVNEFTTTYTCPSGTEEIEGKCYQVTELKDGYNCEQGELDNDKCTITDVRNLIDVCQTEGFIYNADNNTCERIDLTTALEK